MIGAATMLSRLLGLVREQVFAYYFGAGFYTDAFQIAFRIPNLLRDLFAEGAMSAAFVPVYTAARADSDRRAWKLANNAFSFLAVVTIAIVIVGSLYAGQLVNFYAPGFAAFEGKQKLTIDLTRIMWPFLPLVVFAAISMGVLNARERFAIPALSPSCFNLVSIIGAFTICPLVHSIFGLHPIYGMAISVVLGGALQWLVQVPELIKLGWRPKFEIDLGSGDLKKMLWLMGAGTFGLAATQINILVNSLLASGAGEGAVSWLNYAFRLMYFPIGVFGVAISTVALTKVSRQIVSESWGEVNETLLTALNLVFFLTIPSAVGLSVLGIPIIAIIYEHGRFLQSDTIATASALSAYALGLSSYSGIRVMGPIFYSLNKAKVPVLASAVSVLVNIAISVAFVGKWGFIALAMGTSFGALTNFSILLISMAHYRKDFPWASMGKNLIKVLFSAIVMGTVLWCGAYLVGIFPYNQLGESYWMHLRFAQRFTFLVAGLILGVASYGLCARLTGLAEFDVVLDIFKRKVRKIL